MNPLLSRFCVALALPVAVLGAPFHLQFEQPTLDRWMYPFNASPGMRPAAPVFATFGDASGVDTRHGQFLMGWDTGDVIPTNHPPRCYIITFARLTLRTLRDGSFLNDSTADSFASYLPADSFLSAPDGDPGRPVELFGAGFRHGFSEETFVESAPFGAASTAGRNAYAAGFNMEGKLVDVSNNVGKTNAAWLPFPTSPFAVGVIGTVPAGEPVPAGSPVRFDLNLKDPLVLRYLKASLSLGRLRLTATWLGESGGFSGTPRYPDFATRENLLYDPPQLEIGGLLVGAGDTDGDQLPDDWERHWFGGLAHSGSEDADGDGQSNQNELDWDTIPADAASVVLIGSLQSLSDGRIRLYFSSGSPGPFRMETASSMGNWVESSGIFNFPEPLRGEWTSDARTGIADRLLPAATRIVGAPFPVGGDVRQAAPVILLRKHRIPPPQTTCRSPRRIAALFTRQERTAIRGDSLASEGRLIVELLRWLRRCTGMIHGELSEGTSASGEPCRPWFPLRIAGAGIGLRWLRGRIPGLGFRVAFA